MNKKSGAAKDFLAVNILKNISTKPTTMKAIITQTKGDFGSLHGLTFEVVDMHQAGRVSLSIEGNTTDFGFHEVAIIDFQNEMQAAYDNKNWNSGATTTMPSSPRAYMLYDSLKAYRNHNKIGFQPTYSCPA